MRYGNVVRLPGLAGFGSEVNSALFDVYITPLQVENLSSPHAREIERPDERSPESDRSHARLPRMLWIV